MLCPQCGRPIEHNPDGSIAPHACLQPDPADLAGSEGFAPVASAFSRSQAQRYRIAQAARRKPSEGRQSVPASKKPARIAQAAPSEQPVTNTVRAGDGAAAVRTTKTPDQNGPSAATATTIPLASDAGAQAIEDNANVQSFAPSTIGAQCREGEQAAREAEAEPASPSPFEQVDASACDTAPHRALAQDVTGAAAPDAEPVAPIANSPAAGSVSAAAPGAPSSRPDQTHPFSAEESARIAASVMAETKLGWFPRRKKKQERDSFETPNAHEVSPAPADISGFAEGFAASAGISTEAPVQDVAYTAAPAATAVAPAAAPVAPAHPAVAPAAAPAAAPAPTQPAPAASATVPMTAAGPDPNTAASNAAATPNPGQPATAYSFSGSAANPAPIPPASAATSAGPEAPPQAKQKAKHPSRIVIIAAIVALAAFALWAVYTFTQSDAAGQISDDRVASDIKAQAGFMQGTAQDAYVKATDYTLDSIIVNDKTTVDGNVVVHATATLSNDYFAETRTITVEYAQSAGGWIPSCTTDNTVVVPTRGIDNDSEYGISGAESTFDSASQTSSVQTQGTGASDVWFITPTGTRTIAYAFDGTSWVRSAVDDSAMYRNYDDVAGSYKDSNSKSSDGGKLTTFKITKIDSDTGAIEGSYQWTKSGSGWGSSKAESGSFTGSVDSDGSITGSSEDGAFTFSGSASADQSLAVTFTVKASDSGFSSKKQSASVTGSTTLTKSGSDAGGDGWNWNNLWGDPESGSSSSSSDSWTDDIANSWNNFWSGN